MSEHEGEEPPRDEEPPREDPPPEEDPGGGGLADPPEEDPGGIDPGDPGGGGLADPPEEEPEGGGGGGGGGGEPEEDPTPPPGSGGGNSAPATAGHLVSDDTGVLIEPDASTSFAGMGGATSYSIVEGEFYLKALPQPDKQFIKKTVQGISDSFTYETEDLALTSIVNESDMVKVTEMVYQGEVTRVMNQAFTKTSTMPAVPSHPYNRIICEYGTGEYSATSGGINLSSSTCDDIIAIAVDDIRPFLLKSLDINHTAQFRTHKKGRLTDGGEYRANYVPTNEVYIQHLTPDDQPRVAIIETPGYLLDLGVPPIIEVHYDAIDLTGEVVAGTGISSPFDVVNDYAKPWITGDNNYAGHLVVKKTHPSGCQAYATSSGVVRTLADLLKRPFDISGSAPSSIALKVTSPGGIISIPTKNLNKPLKSNMLMSAPTGNITPSPFINIEDCLVNNRESYRGFGRPKGVPSTVVPDPTTSADYHLVRISPGVTDTDYTTGVASSVFSNTSNRAFDVIDNEITANECQILIHPISRKLGGALDGLITEPNNPNNPHSIHLEYTLLKGRIEEIEPGTSTTKDAGITIRGRSMLMDLADQKTTRDFKLSDGTPIKEIGDLGTPTVSLSLGGPGQGSIDVKASRTQHERFPGWKDRIVSSGNASVRNDKQASTYYASTRALVELPLFPSMFYDTQKIIYPNAESMQPLPNAKGFGLTIDCTMTAANRPEMKNQESRFGIDWGVNPIAGCFEVTDSIYKVSLIRGTDEVPVFWTLMHGGAGAGGPEGILHRRPLLKAQRANVTAVVESVDVAAGTITVDDASTWDTAAENGGVSLTGAHHVTIGEGLLGGKNGYAARIASRAGNVFTIADPASELWSMEKNARLTEADSLAAANLVDVKAGMTLTLGSYIVFTGNAADSWDLAVSTHTSHSKADIAEGIATRLSQFFAQPKVLDGGAAIHRDKNNTAKWWLYDVVSMEAFDYDSDESLYSFADRPLVMGVDCRASALSLKGKSSDGSRLIAVKPMELDFNEIASAKDDFNSCFDEVVRRINAAAHPASKQANGYSAFDPPTHQFLTHLAAPQNGSHMGYVRAFEGKEVESRTGEKGKTIVIHSTVPGATSRNFAVWLNNKSPYPYVPTACIGSGGLLTNNSIHYQANSFPAPLPIGPDGDTFVPITTFTGAPHGKLIEKYDNSIRTHTGIGQRIVAKTIIPTVVEDSLYNTPVTGDYANVMVVPRRNAVTQAVHTTTAAKAAFNPADTPPIESIAIDYRGYEAMLSLGSEISASNRGIARINNRLFHFEEINPLSGLGLRSTNGVFLKNITPFDEIEKFYDALFVKDSAGVETDAVGLDVEILWPLVNTKGILFFGGGHTGVTVDISDGTANDYSDSYDHHYSKGPTGFSGLQNLHETNRASAVLDFTLLNDHDTINEDSYIGKHHKLRIRADTKTPIQDCLIHLSMIEENPLTTPAATTTPFDPTAQPFPQNNETILREEIYGRYQKLSAPAGSVTLAGSSPTGHNKFRPIQFHPHTGAGAWPTSGYPYVVCHDWNPARGAAGEAEVLLPHLQGLTGFTHPNEGNRPLLPERQFSISFFFNADWDNGGNGFMSGPIIHAITADGGIWGVSMSGNTATTTVQSFNFALHFMNDAVSPSNVLYARIDEAAYFAAFGYAPQFTKNEWHHIVFTRSHGTPNVVKIIMDGVDLTPYVEIGADGLYNGSAPNARSATGIRHYPVYGDIGSPTAEGVADHPYIPLANGPASTVDPTKAVRAYNMVTVGVALHGAPWAVGGYYFGQGPAALPGQTYGTPQTVPPGDGHNNVGPIYLNGGSLAHIGVWDRELTVAEAQELYASRLRW